MFDFVHKNRQVVSVSLALVGIGLLVGTKFSSGIGGASGPDDTIAQVDGVSVTGQQVEEIMQRTQQKDPAAKQQIVSVLLQQRALLNEADDRNIVASDNMLREAISTDASFKGADGAFDPKLYHDLLAQNHLSVEKYESKIREDMRVPLDFRLPVGGPGGIASGLVGRGVSMAAFGSKVAEDSVLNLLNAARDVSVAEFNAQQYVSRVTVSDAEIKKYYDGHQGEFNVPERVKLDYVLLSRDELAARIPVSDAQAQEYYTSNKARIAPEERSVRHILVKVDAKASPADRAAAHKKAEALLAEVKKNPAGFADVAKRVSDDAASAVNGGDLGYVQNNGGLVKPFSDAAFKLSRGEISDIVETEFGYHIIKVDDVRNKPFDELKPTIIGAIQHETVLKDFAAQVKKFGDSVFLQPESLKPAADAFQLEIRHSDWVTRDKAADPMLNNDKVREAAFSADVLNKHQNSDSIDLGDGGKYISIHVVDHQAASIQPLVEVSAKIADKLKLESAKKLAQEDGKKALAALQKGEQPTVTWQVLKPIDQLDRQGLNKVDIKTIYAVATDKGPGYTGTDEDTGYKVFKVEAAKVVVPNTARDTTVKKQMENFVGMSQTDLYLKDIAARHKINSK